MEFDLIPQVASLFHLSMGMFDEEDSESDEEFEHDILIQLVNSRKRKRRSTAVIPSRIKLFVEITIPNSTDKEFKADFRMKRSTFEKLLCTIGSLLDAPSHTGRRKISARRQLLAVIWLLATPDSYR